MWVTLPSYSGMVLLTWAAAGFYAATAQILPIFLLVMMVGEARLGITDPREPSSLWSAVAAYTFMGMMIIAGEVAALIAVGAGETRLLHFLTCAAIAASAGFLMMRFLFTTFNDYRRHFSREARHRQSRFVILTSSLVLMLTQVTLMIATA